MHASAEWVADSLPVLIAFVDTTCCYRFVNKPYEDWFGRPVRDLIGQRVADVIGIDAFEARREAMDEALSGKPSRIELPVATTADVQATMAQPTAQPVGNGQTALLVEDDESVRLLVKDVLEELGYNALEAAEPQAGVSLLASRRSIDLMICDVGLPGMNDRQLAEVARQHPPELPILFITGYAENAAIRSGFLGTNMAMIAKPFSLDVLAAKIGEMLGDETWQNRTELRAPAG